MIIAIKLMDSEETFFLCGLRWHSRPPFYLKREPFPLGQAHFDSLIPDPEWPFSNSKRDI